MTSVHGTACPGKGIRLSVLLAIQLPLLARLVTSRLVLQTDLAMVTRLGPDATAAFGIPMRIMIIDLVLALALAPLAAIMISESKGALAAARESARRLLALAAALSLALTMVGLVVYPFVVRAVAPDAEVAGLAWAATRWLTLAIPFRFLVSVGTMILHGAGKGRLSMYLGGCELVTNAALNWLFIYRFGMGFSGSYLSTFITSGIMLTCLLVLMGRTFKTTRLFQWPERPWLKQVSTRIASEGARIGGERLVDVAIVATVAHLGGQLLLGAFAIGYELLFLLCAPIVATMRAAVIVLARERPARMRDSFAAVSRVARVGGVALAVVAGLFALGGPWIASHVYDMSPGVRAYWLSCALLLPVILPLRLVVALRMAAFHATYRFGLLAAIQLACACAVLLPVIGLGAALHNGWLFWSAYPICDLTFLFITTIVAQREAQASWRTT